MTTWSNQLHQLGFTKEKQTDGSERYRLFPGESTTSFWTQILVVPIDDCWQVAREPGTGVIVPDPARTPRLETSHVLCQAGCQDMRVAAGFPSGLKAIASWLHERDMRFGVYTAAHGTTCQDRPGSYLYEKIDSASYCEWGVDYL